MDSGLGTREFHQLPHCTDGETEAMRAVALQWGGSLLFSWLAVCEGLCDSWVRVGLWSPAVLGWSPESASLQLRDFG